LSDFDNTTLSAAQVYEEKVAYERYAAGRVGMDGDSPDYCSVSDDGFVDFNFHAGQTRVMQCHKRLVLAIAGRQAGKSDCGAPWLLEEIQARGPGLYMAVAPSYPILEDSLYPKIVDLFQTKMALGKTNIKNASLVISHEGEKVLFEGTKWEKKIKSGRAATTKIRFCHAQRAASLEAKTALACVFDEAGQGEVSVDAIEAIEGRLTTTQGRLLILTTPYELNWLYRRYYLPWEQAKAHGQDHPDIEVIQWPSYLNPAFPRKEYDRQRTLMPAWKHAMFYDGQFTRAAGQIYDCFEEEINVVEPFHIPDHWPRYLGQDYGGSNTCAVHLAECPEDGTLYIYNSYLGGQKNEHEHLREMTKPSTWCEDNTQFDIAAGGNNGESDRRDLYIRAGLYVRKPSINGPGSVEAGIDIVYSLLANRKLRVFSDQTEIINEFNTYSREINPETGDPISGTIKDKNSFHRLDGLRYIAVTIMRGGSDGDTRVLGNIGMDAEYALRGDKFKEEVLGRVSSPNALPLPFGIVALPAPSIEGLPKLF
jgi:hypothetical protein